MRALPGECEWELTQEKRKNKKITSGFQEKGNHL